MARLALVDIPTRFLQNIITEGWRIGYDSEVLSIICTEGIPEGAQFLRAEYDVVRNVFRLIFEHPAFEESTSEIPLISITPAYRREYQPVPERHDSPWLP